MVYCGKASQGCQSCRTRRIKCDKVKPDCSQCVRVGKKCPGYRDQLSLMFRDESSKVIQKAHAQWGFGEGPEAANTTPSPTASRSQASPDPSESSPSTTRATSPPSPTTHDGALVQISPTQEDQGFNFYVHRYLLGHPDEPRNASELKSCSWLWEPTLRDVSTALGLASMSNLNGDKALMVDARRRYGNALRTAGQLIVADSNTSVDTTSRLVVQLALFELVKGTSLSTGSVYAHVAGCAALICSWFPLKEVPDGGVRPLLQLCYSTFITAFETSIPLPAMFHDWVNVARQAMQPEDFPAAELGTLLARFIKVSMAVRKRQYRDGDATVRQVLEKLIKLEAELESWVESLDGVWRYRTQEAPELPSSAIFGGEYHVYHDLWVARVWNHYRWARILVNQVILDTVSRYPISSEPLSADFAYKGRLQTIKTEARDMMVSTPCHWRHPLLNGRIGKQIEELGVGRLGSAGLPILLFHLKVAACAPGIPQDYWDWTYDIMNCIWGDMGMLHAKNMMESMDASVLQRSTRVSNKQAAVST